jgi:hypothetical protein
MALTPEQVKQYRQKYGLDAPEAAAPSATSTPDVAESRISRLKAAASAPNTPPTVGDFPTPTGQNTPNPAPVAEPKRNIFGKVLDFGVDVAKDAANTLLIKPAARTTEAVTRTLFPDSLAAKGFEEMSNNGTSQKLNVLGANFDVAPVKAFGQGGAKQIAGEALKAGSWLYGGGGAKNVVTRLGAGRVGTAIGGAALSGGASGAMYGAGDALEQNKSAGEVVKEGLIGGAVGAAAGGAVGAAAPVASLLYKGGTAAVKAPGQVVNALDDMGTRSLEIAKRTPTAQNAIKSGIDDVVVDFVETAPIADKVAFRDMFNIAKKAGGDMRYRTQPKQVAGATLLDRATHLVKVKDLGVGQTNRVLNSLDQSPVDVSPLLMTYLKDLQEKGVTVVKRGKGFQFANNGAIPEGDLSAYKLMLQMLAPDENGRVLRSYRGLHTARQRIFNELNLAKSRQQTFSPDVDRYADKFRTMLLGEIDKASGGKYKAAQQKTAEAMGALRDFVQLLGYKGDLEKLGTKDLKAAEVASRILGNAADRPISVIQSLDEVAQKYGYKPKGNIMDQIQFADLLEDVFGTTQSRSMRGQVGRGALDAVSEATGAMEDTASGNILALGARAIKAITGKSKEDQIKALGELLESNARPRTNFGR